jgi:RimJ/RimL family protein N-acetyltransferase
VIDFGCSAVGDPACDLAIAWTFFEPDARERFRKTLAMDEATWERGKGWALWKALIVLARLPGTDAKQIASSQHAFDEIVKDSKVRKITFESFEERHFKQLVQWLKTPHVKEFWSEPDDEAELKEKYLSKLGDRGVNSQVILMDNRPIGYIQSYQACKVGGGWWPDANQDVFGIDQFIGDPGLVGKGLGPKIISKFIGLLSKDDRVKEIIVDPDPQNSRAIRAYEKVGFVASGIISTPNGKALLMKYFVS